MDAWKPRIGCALLALVLIDVAQTTVNGGGRLSSLLSRGLWSLLMMIHRRQPVHRLLVMAGSSLQTLIEGVFMAPTELTAQEFEQAIGGNDTLIIDFWAPWCGPCRSFAPTFEAAAQKHPDIAFFKVNTEEEQELAAALRIRSIPTLMVFRDQLLVYAEAGALSAGQLEQLLTAVKQLDMDEVRRDIAEQEGKPE